MRLNPHTPAWAVYNFAYAYLMAGRYDEALRHFDRMPPDSYTPSAYVYRAATLGGLGRIDEADKAVAMALAHNPGLTIEGFVTAFSTDDSQRDRLIETMQAAGFQLCATGAVAGTRRLAECVAS
jgi:tetratricopeptide (TPR) repeat protein